MRGRRLRCRRAVHGRGRAPAGAVPAGHPWLASTQLLAPADGDPAARRRAVALRSSVVAPSPEASLSMRAESDASEVQHELHVPLLLGERAVGVASLARTVDRAFSRPEQHAIEHLADQGAAALSNALLLERTREQAAITRIVLEATPDAIGLFDHEARTLLENAPMRAMRASASGVVGRGFDDEDGRDEIELSDPPRVLQRYAAPVRDRAGDLMGRIVVLREVTAEREADRLKDEFFALVSHELRTPLTSVLGYLELVLGDTADGVGGEERHLLGVAHRNARRLLRLVSDLLFVAQFETGKLALDPVTVDIAAIAREAVEAAAPGAGAARIALRLSAEPVPACTGDPDRLAQAFDNLISNAIKFTPAGGSVDVRVHVRGEVAHVEVADTGVGIPTDEQQLLFQRFFRATTATENAIQGVGLGLTIVKAIVEGHGGRIDVASDQGVGTTFRIYLPLRAPSPRAPARVAPVIAGGVPSGPPARSPARR